jgi:alkanesulfonate monooxygenase SsuD/methylene tetrahydromethanopterin reductase-like flavin-dependent oxidoreductase (luciferase family)
MPALSLAAVPGRRAQALELAVEIERRGFSGIYCPSFGDAMGLCLSIAHATTHIEFGTSIQPIYLQHPIALATSASYLHEVAQGRFRLGIGVTHGPVVKRLGVETGKPLSDMREYVGTMRSAAEQMGGLPPVVLATLRDKMVGLAVEVGDGAVWANASRSRMAHSLALVPADRPAGDYWIGNMIPTVIDDDLAAARARNRKTLQGYVALPNYRNYWIEAGYEAEMAAVIAGLDARDGEAVLAAMSDRWLDDCTLSGPVGRVREGIEAWFDAGVTAPIVVPSSTSGGQAKAFSELFEAFA